MDVVDLERFNDDELTLETLLLELENVLRVSLSLPETGTLAGPPDSAVGPFVGQDVADRLRLTPENPGGHDDFVPPPVGAGRAPLEWLVPPDGNAPLEEVGGDPVKSLDDA